MVHAQAPDWQAGDILLAVAAACMLVSGVLSAVAMGVAWGEFSQGGADIEYRAWELRISGGGSLLEVDYSSNEFDGEEGADLLRASGPLLLTGLILSFLSMATIAVSLFVRGAFLTLSGSIGAAVACVLLLLTAILLPTGIDKNLSSDGGPSPTWTAGFYLGIIATVLALVGTGAGFIVRLIRRQAAPP